MKVLFVNSGIPGFPARYAYDIHTCLRQDFHCLVRQTSPQNLSKRLIREFNPDLLLVVHGTYTKPELVRYAGERGVSTVLWLVEDPYEIDYHRGKMVEAYQYIFTTEQRAVREYDHPRVYYLPWCCNPRVHQRVTAPPAYWSDLLFVGMGFPNRLRIINYLAPLLKKMKVVLIGDWESWGRLHPDLRGKVRPVTGDFWEIRKYYNGARINLNIHRDPVDPPSGNSRGVGAESPNDRTFALAGCAAFQLVDRTRAGLWDCFTDGVEMAGFTDPDDLAEKIQEYLAKPVKRTMIGEAAQQRAYRQHTYRHRLGEIFLKVRRFPEKNWETTIRTSPPQVFVFPASAVSPGPGLLYKTRGVRDR